jgi:hypothetical protein
MLIFEKPIISFLQFSSRNYIISQILISGGSTHLIEIGNYIKIEDDGIDVISYLPIGKYDKVDDVWNNSLRVKTRIGRFVMRTINRISIDRYNVEAELEKFVNSYKSYFSKESSNLVVVSGDDIRKYYLESNYFSMEGSRYGSLWNSCMRQRERNKFMELYCVNDDSVKMLVSLSEDGKVRARALLWDKVIDVNTGKEYKFMDRIYTFFDYDTNTFKDWAKENGYITKYDQSAKTEIHFLVDNKHVVMELKVNLENHKLDYYPYLDTFKFYDPKSGTFSNTPTFKSIYKLVQSNGMLEPERREERESDDWEMEPDDDDAWN